MQNLLLLVTLMFAGLKESEQAWFYQRRPTPPVTPPIPLAYSQCGGIDGKWCADWANIDIKCTVDSEDKEMGSLAGTFRNTDSAEGDFYYIRGRYNMVLSDVTFGFVAAWNNPVAGNWNLTASWAGILQGDSPDKISAFWISATDNKSPDQWSSYGLGKHEFTRCTSNTVRQQARRRPFYY